MTEIRKNIYFASDFHLGVPDHDSSLRRELLLVKWLEEITPTAKEIFLMGDIFDFWFEYKTVVPKGYVRLLGKIATLTDNGIPVHIFRGNHDLWAFDYLQKETGAILYRRSIVRDFDSKKFFLSHGDGLGPGDTGYKLLKRVFENRFNQFLFNWLHPDIGTRLGLYFSHKSRIANIAREQKNDFKIDIEKEMLYMYCQKKLETQPDIDYFIFGHRHVPINHALNEKSRLIILGDWVINFTYAVFDGENLELKKYNT
ncbi:MAG: UDP-2,3-diacylglucosamine diphosphatase [Bacteroidales bacterium]|nr:UDP-2,3-diacylglucosamine diphosphatase [Bacteroidales bacterium]